jgi:hypothetical protein
LLLANANRKHVEFRFPSFATRKPAALNCDQEFASGCANRKHVEFRFPSFGFAGRWLHARRFSQGTSFSFAENRSLLENLRSTATRSLLLAGTRNGTPAMLLRLWQTAPFIEVRVNPIV